MLFYGIHLCFAYLESYIPKHISYSLNLHKYQYIGLNIHLKKKKKQLCICLVLKDALMHMKYEI